MGLLRFHPDGGDVPLRRVKVDLQPLRSLQFARADEDQGRDLQGAFDRERPGVTVNGP